MCGLSALALKTNAPTVLREEALSYPDPNGATAFGSSARCAPEKVICANSSAVREWDSNGTVFGYNPNIPGHLNEYALAIRAVGDIIQDYDTDKLFPVWGFGARLPPNQQISHRFAVNFNPADPNCHRVEGCLEAYQRCVRSVRLWGPTNFSPIIRGFVEDAKQDLSGRQYWVLLMITDGIISDMEPTKKAIVEAAKYPVSIIIVGVGDANFDNMDVLDGDDVRVSYNGEAAVRDIVQFVPLRDFMKKGTGQVMSQARLAQEVLQEIPEQVTEYMQQHGITPMQPVMDYQRSVLSDGERSTSLNHQYSVTQQMASISMNPPPNYK